MRRITRDEVYRVLSRYMGQRAAGARMDLCDQIAILLGNYFYDTITLDALYDRLEELVFSQLYEMTQGTMAFETDDGRVVKVRNASRAAMCEELMALVLSRFPVCRAAYWDLNGYAMRHTSLPALRRLYLDFGEYATDMDRELIRRLIVENFDKEQYETWLGDAG